MSIRSEIEDALTKGNPVDQIMVVVERAVRNAQIATVHKTIRDVDDWRVAHSIGYQNDLALRRLLSGIRNDLGMVEHR